MAPPVATGGSPARRALLWARRNLFNSWYNSLLTVVALWIIYRALAGLFDWGIVTAAIGTTPADCEGASGACWAFVVGNRHLFAFGTYPFDERWRPLLATAVIALLLLLGLCRSIRTSRVYRLLWLATPILAFVLIRGVGSDALPVVDTSFWGGLMLTLLMASTGMIVALPLGILLALGRRANPCRWCARSRSPTSS